MFFECKTKEEAKQFFRKLAFRLHPDHGGTNEMMISLQKCYDREIEFIGIFSEFSKEDEKTYDHDKPYENAYEKLFKGDDRLKIIDDIYSYASKHEKYKTYFIDSICDFLQVNGYVTCNQYNCLVKNFYAFEMNEKIKK